MGRVRTGCPKQYHNPSGGCGTWQAAIITVEYDLKAIYQLSDASGGAPTGELARHLKITPGSVTLMLLTSVVRRGGSARVDMCPM
jgi:hypothetical protein